MTGKVILVEPEIPENTGFIARLAANFGYNLRIVDPEFNLSEARSTASRAQGKLREAEIFDSVSEAVKDLDYVVGTKPGRGRGMTEMSPRRDISVMIGRESSGLTGDELEMCDGVVHISTGGYESINQSHAAAILLHHFRDEGEAAESVSQGQKKVLEKELPAKVVEKIVEANPSRDEVNSIIGDLKDEKNGK